MVIPSAKHTAEFAADPATLTIDVVAAAELDDVMYDQEVTREPQLFDDGEFVINLDPGTFDLFIVTGAVPADGMPFGQLTQPAHLVETLRARKRW